LIGQVGGIPTDVGWPFFVIAPGVALFVLALAGDRTELAIPGSIVTMVGLLLFYQNSFQHWESWAYAWPLVAPTAVGLGLWIGGIWEGKPHQRRAGQRLVQIGLALFLAFGLFFEGILNVSGFGGMTREVARFALPVGLIGLGGYLLTTRWSRAA
jgi:hypothetical protein